MTIIIPIPAVACGILSGLLYHIIGQGWIYGITAPFIPLFILSLMGIMYGRAGITVTALACAPTLLLFLDLSDALLIMATQLVPVCVFVRTLMSATIRTEPPAFVWTSLGSAVSATALYAACYYIAMIATNNKLYLHIVTMLRDNAKASFSSLEPEMAVTVESLVTDVPHVVLALEFWGWAITFVAVLMMAQFVAETFKRNRRPAPALRNQSPPNLLLAALGISGAASFLSTPQLVQAGQAASIILLLPYFFSGLGFIHARARSIKHGSAYLIGFYIFFIITMWPLLLVTLLGLLRHLSRYTLSLPNMR